MNRCRPASSRSNRVSGERGYGSLPMVIILAIIISASLVMLFRQGLMNRDQAAKSQLRVDYHQREESLLRALVAVFPQKAIDCLKADHAEADAYSWNTLFSEAVAMASAGESLPEETWASLGLGSARRSNVADTDNVRVESWITSLNGVAGDVTPGTVAYAGVFDTLGLTSRIPPLLTASSALQTADAARPVVSGEKVYAAQSPGLLADITQFPAFNLIAYPNVRFSYAAPGQPFVAKRNWWAFQITYGAAAGGGTAPVPVITKRYILSLYEIPTQMPIEATTLAEVGQHQDGTPWNAAAIEIDGSVYADRVLMRAGYGTDRVTGRRDIQIDGTIDLDGSTVGTDFDEPGVREQLQVERNTDVLPAALSPNSGRLVFLPLQRGGNFLRVPGTTNQWESYTRGARQCQIRVNAVEMEDIADQLPRTIRVNFLLDDGTEGEVVLRRGVNWPADPEPGSELIPFQSELTLTHRSCLSFYPGRLNAWLLSHGGAGVATNRSLFIQPDSTADPTTVRPLPADVEALPDPDDMAVIIRQGKDLTSFTSGLSIVTPLRVYVGDDLNSLPAPGGPPAGSGLPNGTIFYPPLSLFAAELRIGTTAFVRPFEHHGQIGTLITGGTDSWQPLDLRSGADDSVLQADQIAAELTPLRSPAELPPVHLMNWLVTVEEIPTE